MSTAAPRPKHSSSAGASLGRRTAHDGREPAAFRSFSALTAIFDSRSVRRNFGVFWSLSLNYGFSRTDEMTLIAAARDFGIETVGFLMDADPPDRPAGFPVRTWGAGSGVSPGRLRPQRQQTLRAGR